jgi:hypothetical protein
VLIGVGGVIGFFVVPVIGAVAGVVGGAYLGERMRFGSHASAWASTKRVIVSIGKAWHWSSPREQWRSRCGSPPSSSCNETARSRPYSRAMRRLLALAVLFLIPACEDCSGVSCEVGGLYVSANEVRGGALATGAAPGPLASRAIRLMTSQVADRTLDRL